MRASRRRCGSPLVCSGTGRHGSTSLEQAKLRFIHRIGHHFGTGATPAKNGDVFDIRPESMLLPGIAADRREGGVVDNLYRPTRLADQVMMRPMRTQFELPLAFTIWKTRRVGARWAKWSSTARAASVQIDRVRAGWWRGRDHA